MTYCAPDPCKGEQEQQQRQLSCNLEPILKLLEGRAPSRPCLEGEVYPPLAAPEATRAPAEPILRGLG